MLEKWEMVRWQSFWTAALPNKKGGFKFKDIELPFDQIKKGKQRKTGKIKKLSRDEIRQRYQKSGFKISEEALDKMTK